MQKSGDNGGSDDKESSEREEHGLDHGLKGRRIPDLRREAVFVRGERQRIAVIAALCSLAGVGLGFGLGQVATANSNCVRHEAVQHEASHTPGPIMQQAHGYTWLGVEVKGGCHIQGAMVTKVVADSPAEQAGLEPGDVIVEVGDSQVMSPSDLVRAVRRYTKGQAVQVVTKSSKDVRKTLQVTLGTINRRELHRWQRSTHR